MWGWRVGAATVHIERARSCRRPGLRDLTEAAVVTTVVCVLEAVVLTGTAEYRGFVAGLVAATTFWLVALRLLGTPPKDARERSRELIDAVPNWRAVHDLPLGGRTLDHVVVTPLAVLAVRSEHWRDGNGRERAVDEARRDARDLAQGLARLGVEVPVWPAVVAWGPGARVTELGPVDVVAGADADSWTAAYATGAISRSRAAQVHAGLVRLASGREHRTLDLRQGAVTSA
jgi:hypothetical protein